MHPDWPEAVFDKSADHGNELWQWRNVLILFLALAIYPETSTKMHVKTSGIISKNRSTTAFHFDVISMVDRSTDNGKLLPIAN